MTKIYLIRHAEAEGNLYRRGQGHFDGKVTQMGMKQIDALAERFLEIPVDAVYSSDLSRTQSTADGVLRNNPQLELRLEPRLREICMGVWEDRSWGTVAYEDPEQMRNFNHDPDNWRVEGAETFSELTRRMTGIILELAEKHDGQTIAAVSHGMAIRALLCNIMKISPKDISQIPHSDNTAVSLLTVENGEISIEFYNSNSHVPPAISTFAKQTWWKEKSGTERNNLRFEPLNLEKEAALYTRSYADTWIVAHGSIRGFDAEHYLRRAGEHAKEHPEALMKAMRDDEFAGIIELDIERHKEHNAGWITLCTLSETSRNQRLGVQLIGHAISVFRRLGRERVRLYVSGHNRKAVGFYEYYGFGQIAVTRGTYGTLLMLEKEI